MLLFFFFPLTVQKNHDILKYIKDVNRIMHKILKSIQKKFKDNTFIKTYALILLPVLIIFIFLLVSTFSYNKNLTELLKDSYLTRLEAICTENETSLQNITTMIRLMSDNNDFMNVALNTGVPEQSSLDTISDTLTQLKDNNNLIDSIALYNRSNNTIYSDSGTSNAINYFSYEYCYSDYGKDFWDYYKSPLSERKILSPTLVDAKGSTKIIIPIVFTKIGAISTSNLVIVNVNLSKILNYAKKSKLTDNSTFLIINKQNKNIFNENNNFSSKVDESFFNGVFSGNSIAFDSIVDNQRTLVMSYSPNDSILGYSYIATVPYTDINSRLSNITYFLIIAGLLVFVVVLWTAYFSTKKIYTPIEDLASLFENSDSPEKATNTLQRLHTSIQETLESNSSLSNEVSKALPLIQERYLINLLNSNEHYTPDDKNDLPINFHYEYFCSVVIKLKPTEQFYQLYNNMEYNAIKTGIHNIIQSSFSETFETYIIPSETDTLYVLLNLEDNTNVDSIFEILEEFQNVMTFDKDYMTLKIGIGGVYPHLDGLKKSHHEAINSVSTFIGLSHVKVPADKEKLTTYVLSMNDENTLLNNLILGRIDDAKNTIERVLQENVNKNISDSALMQLYVQILNIVFKVMRMKEIPYDSNSLGDFHIITEIIKQPISDVHKTIMSYIDIIRGHMTSSGTKIDIQAIISYMEEHYAEDIGLESIADNFNTTAKYLSKLIKDKLGVNFLDYLSGLRINAAKLLLTETDKNISDIFTEVGFNNRNTFIRTFKKNTGLTPTEFRKSKDGIE